MKATTIKLDGELLLGIERACPTGKSVSAFVREVLKSELDRREMSKAAESYAKFLSENKEESKELHEWESAIMETSPAYATGRKRSLKARSKK